MGPAQAIRTGLLRSFRFSGRASRSEFWWFAPVALVPPVFAGSQLDWDRLDFWGIWRVLLLMLLSVPLLAAMSRRLQDMGEPGHQAIYPFMPFVLLWLGYQFLYWFSAGTAFLIIGYIIGWLAILLLVPLYILCFVAAIFVTASIIGMMLVSSQPGSNRYGPNPLEVTP